MPSWHQSLVLERGPDASTTQIWPNLISTFDVWSEVWLGLQAGSAGGIRGTKFCMSGINACEKWSHWKFSCHIMNLPYERWARRMLHWQPSGKRTFGTSSNELDDQIWTIFSGGVIGRRWLQMLTGGWWRRTSSSNFVHRGRIRLTGCFFLPTFRPGNMGN